MKKILLLLSLLFVLTACNNQFVSTQNSNNNTQEVDVAKIVGKAPEDYGQMSSIATVADKVEVFLFHTMVRCVTCTAIGKLSAETVNERFQEEIKSGKVEFREINIDLPENKELAKKFQASGSILFINSIYNNSDHIRSDAKVWRLTGNSEAFKNYLEEQINISFGK